MFLTSHGLCCFPFKWKVGAGDNVTPELTVFQYTKSENQYALTGLTKAIESVKLTSRNVEFFFMWPYCENHAAFLMQLSHHWLVN